MLTEEVLLEALCFDFVVDCPHADLVDIFASRPGNQIVQEYAWSIAHDSLVPSTFHILCLTITVLDIERRYVCYIHQRSLQLLVTYMHNVWQMRLTLHLLMNAFQHRLFLNKQDPVTDHMEPSKTLNSPSLT